MSMIDAIDKVHASPFVIPEGNLRSLQGTGDS
jgi:hypothetical protein